MDYSKFSTSTLGKIAQGQKLDYSQLTDDELKEIAGPSDQGEEQQEPSMVQSALDAAKGGLTSLGSQIVNFSPQRSLGAAQDLLTGAAEMTGISQPVRGALNVAENLGQQAGHAIAPSLVPPASSQPLSQIYKQGTQDVQREQQQALEQSPLAYRTGELGGLGLSALGMGAINPAIPTPQGAGALTRAAVGALNNVIPAAGYGLSTSPGAVIGGTPQEQQQALQDTLRGGLFGAGMGAAAGIASPAAKAIAKTTLVKAFKAASEGADLTSENAVTNAGQDLLSESQAVSNQLEDQRRLLGQTRQQIEDSQNNQNVDIGDILPDMSKRIEGIKGTTKVEQQKNELLDFIKPEAPYNEVTPIVENTEAVPGTQEKLDKMGQLAVKRELLLGNKATYEIVPSTDEDGKEVLSLLVKKQTSPTGPGEALVPGEEGEEPSLVSSPENYGGETVSATTRYAEPGTPAGQETTYEPGEEIGNRQLISPQMSLKQALDLRTRLRSVANDDTYHPDVRKAASDSFRLLQGKLQQQVPELQQNDALYSAIKKAQQVFGKEYGAQDEITQAGDISKLMQQAQGSSLNSQVAKAQLKQAFSDLSKVNPDLAQQLQQSLGKKLDIFNLAQQASEPNLNPLHPIRSIKEAGAYIGAKAAPAANPLINESKMLYSAPIESLKTLSTKLELMGNSGKAMSQALNKALDNNNIMAKNAILFSIMQNPAYRSLISPDNLNPGE